MTVSMTVRWSRFRSPSDCSALTESLIPSDDFGLSLQLSSPWLQLEILPQNMLKQLVDGGKDSTAEKDAYSTKLLSLANSAELNAGFL